MIEKNVIIARAAVTLKLAVAVVPPWTRFLMTECSSRVE